MLTASATELLLNIVERGPRPVGDSISYNDVMALVEPGIVAVSHDIEADTDLLTFVGTAIGNLSFSEAAYDVESSRAVLAFHRVTEPGPTLSLIRKLSDVRLFTSTQHNSMPILGWTVIRKKERMALDLTIADLHVPADALSVTLPNTTKTLTGTVGDRVLAARKALIDAETEAGIERRER